MLSLGSYMNQALGLHLSFKRLEKIKPIDLLYGPFWNTVEKRIIAPSAGGMMLLQLSDLKNMNPSYSRLKIPWKTFHVTLIQVILSNIE